VTALILRHRHQLVVVLDLLQALHTINVAGQDARGGWRILIRRWLRVRRRCVNKDIIQARRLVLGDDLLLQFGRIAAALQALLLPQVLQLLRRTLLPELKDEGVNVLDSRFHIADTGR